MKADPLSDLLQTVRLDGAYFYSVEARGPWRVEAVAARELTPRVLPGAEHLISYHIVTAGNCRGGVTGGSSALLEAGDIIVFPQGDPHVMTSLDATDPVSMLDWAPARYPDTLRVGGNGGPIVNFVCGFLGCDRRPFNPLLAALPPQIHLRGNTNGWLHAFAHQVVEESKARRPGAESILTRLAELMFVEVLRRHLELLPPAQTGWLAGLRDEFVGPALGLLHAEPGHGWTLDELARDVGLSRSSFADRFTGLVGQAPMQYLTRWRMQLAAGRLARGNEKLAAIAEESGYESEAAFSRAFKREVGLSPSAWRAARAARPAP